MHFASSFRDSFAHGTRNLVYCVSLDVLYVLSLKIYWVGLFYGRFDYEVSTELALKVFWLANIFFATPKLDHCAAGCSKRYLAYGAVKCFF